MLILLLEKNTKKHIGTLTSNYRKNFKILLILFEIVNRLLGEIHSWKHLCTPEGIMRYALTFRFYFLCIKQSKIIKNGCRKFMKCIC